MGRRDTNRGIAVARGVSRLLIDTRRGLVLIVHAERQRRLHRQLKSRAAAIPPLKSLSSPEPS